MKRFAIVLALYLLTNTAPAADLLAVYQRALQNDPQLREAETEASGRLPGTPVQRLATIARGDGIYATHVTAPSLGAHPQYHDQHRRRHNNN